MQHAAPVPSEHEAEAIERLLERVSAVAAPGIWPMVEELVQRLTALYGAGLAHALRHARAAGVDESAFAGAVAGDAFLSSLLVLHDLHPQPARERILAALDRVRPQLGLHAGGVELVEIDERGMVLLRLTGNCDGCASSQATLEQSIRAAVEAAAPEVTGIELEGATVALPVLS